MDSRPPAFPSTNIPADVDRKGDGQLSAIKEKFDALEKELHLLYEHVPFGYHTLDSDGIYLDINPQELAWLGYAREDVIGKMRFSAFLTPDSQARFHRFFPDSMKGGYVVDLEVDLIGKDGTLRQVTLYSNIVLDKKGCFLKYRSVLYDHTELKQTEAKLRIAATVFEAQEGMLVANTEGLIISANHSFTTITGYSPEEVIGKNPCILSSGRHNREFYAAMWEQILRLGFWEGEIWNKRKNGEIYPEHLCITAVKDRGGVVQNYVGTLTDITLSKEAADEIQNLAFYDPLTRLPNRRLLMDRLNIALASSSRTGKQGALLLLDLDNFKTLNDTLGHDKGDLILQQTARRIEACLRAGDTVSRLGGDEFVVMLENLNEQPLIAASETKVVGTKILAALDQNFPLDTYSYHITSSIGATVFNNQKAGIAELFKQADIAMYQAKKSGRNTMRFFDPQMQANIIARATFEQELQQAVTAEQFKLFYQVQVDASGKSIGAEALVRWLHPARGLILPSQFIPLAEETGLILPIGSWVLNAACAQLNAWANNETTKGFTLSVNVSAKQFHQTDFVTQVQTAIDHHGVNPSLLKLEPTESVLLENIDDTVATMNALKMIGIHFALDDFGTGFSSLQYLKKLPLNQLKIDQSFVRDLLFDGSDQVIVRTIIAMAHSLNLEVIAEGVETEAQKQLLQDNGCNHFQGYLFGKPLPIEQFEASLTGT